jgi:hypothetical protein
MSRYVALSDPAHAATRVDLAREVVSVAETFGETESAKRGQERLHQASADLDAARAIEAESVATTPPVHEPPSAPEPRPTEALPVPPRPGAFRREGGIWMIGLDAASCHLKDLIGLRYLEQLLRSPGQEFHVLDLVTTVSGSDAGLPRSSDVGPMLDAGAKTAYRRRLADLREEADEAEHFADVGRRERAQAEIDALTAELTSAVGLGGRDRVTGATTERARSTVTHAIRSAIRRLHKDVPTLAEELDLRVRTGIYCLYVPDSTRPIAWTF